MRARPISPAKHDQGELKMTRITTRNILRLWWDTAPALVGYPDYPGQQQEKLAELLASTPFCGTARQVLEEIARVRRNVGQGAYIRFEIRTANGAYVDINQVSDVVAAADCRRAA
jgi:hypothetical protein